MVHAQFQEQSEFRQQLRLEKKRTQRAETSFILVLLEAPWMLRAGLPTLDQVRDCIRDTDICGWYTEQSVLGIIFIESKSGESGRLVDELKSRLKATLSADEYKELSFSVYVGAEPETRDESDRLHLVGRIPSIRGMV